MAIRQIRVQGDDVLTKVCRPVKEITPRIATLIEDMIDTMYEYEGGRSAQDRSDRCRGRSDRFSQPGSA